MIKQKASYRPNLPDLMELCAINYMLALKLLANKEVVGEKREFSIADKLQYVITVNEVTKYTSLITIEQLQQLELAELADILAPKMVIRLYHDAQAAEVVSSQAIRHIKPKYHYPNELMLLPDEKLQVNAFLKEWLQVCLMHGQTQVPSPSH
ncbi:DUF1249 domain-containing protein [Thalassotalea sp. M1531]|uniref:DUF1249 domain-containing protein n=1 Tax=Thalassotalea algicola TaxID=2716224 RepID=A0A7Y0LCV8_9GAMM|nr:DUF1249 domain-containing protein [Thalassotalea algicola]NMP32263.1 DUF1249 domain-containing protein [Thalassotalea algicola]